MSGGPQPHPLESGFLFINLADIALDSLELTATMPQPFCAGITPVYILLKLLKIFHLCPLMSFLRQEQTPLKNLSGS